MASPHPCPYFMSDEAAQEYFSISSRYADTCTAWILDFYHQTHPDWVPGASKIPLVVDVGCGGGQLTSPLSQHSQRVLGLDVSPAMLEVAKRENNRINVEYRQGLAEDLSEFCPAAGVDLIVVGEAAHYFDTDEFYSEVKKCLRPGGVLAIVGFWYQGIKHEDPKFGEFVTNLNLHRAIDEVILQAGRKLADGYRSLHCPLEVTRREATLYFEMTREEIRAMLKKLAKNLYRGSALTVDKAVDSLPAMDRYSYKLNVFGLFYQH